MFFFDDTERSKTYLKKNIKNTTHMKEQLKAHVLVYLQCAHIEARPLFEYLIPLFEPTGYI